MLHGLAADRQGNVLINNNMGIDLELVYLADTVIATVERVVDKLERSTDGVIIPYPGCTMIVELPGGAAPTSCYPLYPLDGAAFLQYTDACHAGNFHTFLREFLQS